MKLDMESVKESVKYYGYNVANQQILVFAMCGGGMLGRFATEQPADFYIDDRVGKLPYPKREIIQAVRVLVAIAEVEGLDPHKLPTMPRIHNSGIF